MTLRWIRRLLLPITTKPLEYFNSPQENQIPKMCSLLNVSYFDWKTLPKSGIICVIFEERNNQIHLPISYQSS